MVCANENITDDANSELSVGDTPQNHNIKDLIDECEDNGTVSLDENTYYLNPENETHIVLNKSITIKGIEGKTIIDGNNTSLFLDVNETQDNVNNDTPIIFWREGYVFKDLGKNITFKNIIFKDLNMTTWHEMTFENCKFINTTFTSYEFGNTFKNCSFDKSKIEIGLFIGYENDLYEDYSKIINCNFRQSIITFKSLYSPNYIEFVGGSRFWIRNCLDLINSNLYDSNITLSDYNITITNSNFNNSNMRGSSNRIKIANSSINNPEIHFSLSDISLNNSNITNGDFHMSAGYFGHVSKLTILNTIINNCSMDITTDYGAGKTNINLEKSFVNNSTIKSEDSNVLIDNCEFNKSSIELFFSDAQIKNSIFNNDWNVTETIRTINYYEVFQFDDDTFESGSVVKIECQVKTNYTVENSYLVNNTGKYEINAKDINMDTSHKITIINNSEVYIFNDNLIINVKDNSGNPVSDLEIFIRNLNDETELTTTIKTDSNGIAKYNLNKIGNLCLKVYYTDRVEFVYSEYGINLNLTVIPTITGIKVNKINFASNKYSIINSKLKINTIVNNSATNLKNIKYAFKVYTNGKSKTYYSLTDSKGIATFKMPKTLTVGTHKIEISILNTKIKKTINVKIAKAKTTVKASKVVNHFKKSEFFKVTVKFAKKEHFFRKKAYLCARKQMLK